MILFKRFDIFSPLTGGCSEGLDAFIFFFLSSRIAWEGSPSLHGTIFTVDSSWKSRLGSLHRFSGTIFNGDCSRSARALGRRSRHGEPRVHNIRLNRRGFKISLKLVGVAAGNTFVKTLFYDVGSPCSYHVLHAVHSTSSPSYRILRGSFTFELRGVMLCRREKLTGQTRTSMASSTPTST